MRVLIDECVDPRVKLLFGDHECATVHTKAGRLSKTTPCWRSPDVLVTIDSRMEFQQNIPKLQIGVVVVHVPRNQLAGYRVLQKELLLTVEKIQPGEVIHVRTPTVSSMNERQLRGKRQWHFDLRDTIPNHRLVTSWRDLKSREW